MGLDCTCKRKEKEKRVDGERVEGSRWMWMWRRVSQRTLNLGRSISPGVKEQTHAPSRPGRKPASHAVV